MVLSSHSDLFSVLEEGSESAVSCAALHAGTAVLQGYCEGGGTGGDGDWQSVTVCASAGCCGH